MMSDATIEKWLKSQAIGLAAYAAGALSAINNDVAKRLRPRAMLRLSDLLGEWKWEKPARMVMLPASVLHVLAALDDGHVVHELRGRIQPAARRALEYLTPRQDSPLAVAEILAHQIMHGSGSATRITRFAVSLDRDSYTKLTKMEKRTDFKSFSAAVEALRDRDGGTTGRIKAIAALSAFSALPYPDQLRNILLQHAFAWPLLVCSGTAISLPVAVDVELALHDGGRDRVLVQNHDAFDLEFVPVDENGGRGVRWIDHLRIARDTAQLLWAKTHGNCGEFRPKVRRHQARFDFAWASRVVRLAFGVECTEQLPLAGGSATAYFAQIVLSRLLGKRWYLSSAITGAVGKRVAFGQKEDHRELPKGELDRDFWFKAVDDVAAKLRFIRTTHAFERLVIPVENEPDIDAARRASLVDGDNSGANGDEVQIAYQKKLSGVADVVQVEGWRKTQFIRCPEVADAIHGEGRNVLPVAHGAEATEVREQIAAHGSSIFWLEARPAVVASAVAEINFLLHKHAQRIIAGQSASSTRAIALAHQRERRLLAPGLSWCVFRAVEEEQDASFWRTLWRVIGAPVPDFERFRDSATRAVAATRLAEAMNRYTPVEYAPSHSAPDFIVLVGLEKFRKGLENNKTPLARPLAVVPLLQELDDRNLLEPSSNRRNLTYVRQLAGVARFVIVPECNEDPVPQGKIDLSDEERHAMEVLKTFRFGFSQQMAGMLLSECELHGVDVRKKLLDLTSKGALRKVSGQYFMSRAMRQELQEDTDVDDATEAARQRAAGVALAPYTTSAPASGLAYDAAFLSENVKEAEVHFMQAFRLYGRTGNEKMRQEIGPCFQRVCRFASVPDWGTVDRLNKARLGKDAYELAEELMAGWRSHGGDDSLPPHPSHYIEAIEGITHWKVGGSFWDKAKRLYKDGLAACSAYPSEAAFCEIQVAAAYSAFLSRIQQAVRGDIAEADARVWDHRDHWTHVRGDWFEKNGDCFEDHHKAALHYRLGTRYAPQYRQNWIKYLGALALAKERFLQVLNRIPRQNEKEAIEWCRHIVNPDAKKSRKRLGPHVSQRWTATFPILCDYWRRIPECAEMLDKAMKHVSR